MAPSKSTVAGRVPVERTDRIGARYDEFRQRQRIAKIKKPDSKFDKLDIVFLEKLAYRGSLVPGECTRRFRLVEDRRRELRDRNEDRTTTKGTVVGWYLDPLAHEPLWTTRKVSAYHNLQHGDEQVKASVKADYNIIKSERSDFDYTLTAAEIAMIRTKTSSVKPVPQPAQHALEIIMATLAKVAPVCQHIEEAGSAIQPQHDAEFAKWEQYQREDAKNNALLFKVMKKDAGEDLWVKPGEEFAFE